MVACTYVSDQDAAYRSLLQAAQAQARDKVMLPAQSEAELGEVQLTLRCAGMPGNGLRSTDLYPAT